jgi:hypothetical protein
LVGYTNKKPGHNSCLKIWLILVRLRQMVGKGKIVLSKKVSAETPPHRQAAKR